MKEQIQKHARKYIKVGYYLKVTLGYRGLILPRTRNISDQISRDNQNTLFVFSNFFLLEIRAVYEIKCKHRVKLETHHR
jgi:hypothetical protein